jgi:hypothetical protein
MAEDGERLSETITLSQAKLLIRSLAHEQSLLLLSPPGVGKSDIVRQAADEAGLPCRSLLGTQIAPEDVSGIPRIVGERSVFCPPRVLLPEDSGPFCLFLDELPACAPDIQKSFYSLLLERRLGEHALPKGTWVVAAGNRAEDRSLVRTISSALINRVALLQVRADVSEWLAWAEANGIREDVRTFISDNNDALIRPIPNIPGPCSTPRAWASLSRALDLAEGKGILSVGIQRALAYGRVSEGDARKFCGEPAWNGQPESLLLAVIRYRDEGNPISGDNKIPAIKTIRNTCGCGLKEAKDAVEAVLAMSEDQIQALKAKY